MNMLKGENMVLSKRHIIARKQNFEEAGSAFKNGSKY